MGKLKWHTYLHCPLLVALAPSESGLPPRPSHKDHNASAQHRTKRPVDLTSKENNCCTTTDTFSRTTPDHSESQKKKRMGGWWVALTFALPGMLPSWVTRT